MIRNVKTVLATAAEVFTLGLLGSVRFGKSRVVKKPLILFGQFPPMRSR